MFTTTCYFPPTLLDIRFRSILLYGIKPGKVKPFTGQGKGVKKVISYIEKHYVPI
jgi:hypothetical protein